MTQKELQKKYKCKKVIINFEKLFGKFFNNANFYQNSVNNKTGKINTEDYSLNSTILINLTCLNCMMIDPENWQKELDLCHFRFDESTLKFLDDLCREIWCWQCETVGPNATEEQLDNTKIYIPLMREWFMWNIYLILNEVNKYLFNEVMFNLAEDIITDKNMSGFIDWLTEIKKVKKNMNNFCNKYLEIAND